MFLKLFFDRLQWDVKLFFLARGSFQCGTYVLVKVSMMNVCSAAARARLDVDAWNNHDFLQQTFEKLTKILIYTVISILNWFLCTATTFERKGIGWKLVVRNLYKLCLRNMVILKCDWENVGNKYIIIYY